MARIFKTPFGAQGDTEQVPEAPQGDGSVSLTQGFGYDYEREYEDPAAKDIRREVMNGLFHDITEAIGDIQLSGVAKWDAAAAPYPAGAIVWHASAAWLSRVGNNIVEPVAGDNWRAVGIAASDTVQGLVELATNAEVIAGTDNVRAITPAGLSSRTALESRTGLVQLATTAEAQALTDDTKALTPKKLLDSGAVFAGEVRVFAGAEANIPEGWLPCNGAAISRTTYSRLFGAVGTTYGSGNGSTTFNVPDLRGVFVRGLDNGRGVDSGRTLGSAQLDALQNITGAFVGRLPGTGAFSGSGSATTFTTGSSNFNDMTFDASRVARTADETRPRNVAMNYIIKY